MKTKLATGAALLLALAVCLGATSMVQDLRPVATPRAVLDRYCVTCHNERLKTAGLMLDRLDPADVQPRAEVWEKVVRKLRSGAMPPQGAPHPDAATAAATAAFLEGALDRAAAAHPRPGRTPALHRLNRAEYGNAIRDLLALDIDAASLLPPDDSGYGFDNIADVLSVSPALAERYLSAALKISRLAVGDRTIRPVTETFALNKYLKQDDRVSEDLPFGSRGGIAIHHDFPVDADYIVKIFLDRTYDGRIRGLSEPHQLEVRVNSVRIKELTVGGVPLDAEGNPVPRGRGRAPAPEADGLEIRFAALAGPADLGLSFVKKAAEPEGMLRPPYAVTSYEYAGDVVVAPAIARVELRGPYDVKGTGDSPSRRRVFVCQGTAQGSEGKDESCAREILSTLARRAYRRPVGDSDVQPLVDFYKAARASGGFDAGIEAALRRLLVSPGFLFRIEHDGPGAPPARISDVELASRLSFFIWSSIPDDELLDVAARGALREPAVLERQVRRMLANQRSTALVTNFGGQWLYLRNMRLVTPDPIVFPDFDENLRQAFEREMQLFLDSQVREDHSVSDLLTADYTFVNERLARHYGMPNVYGTHFRRVTVTDDARKGLLGKGAILTVTSYPHRTSPVLRGKFLLENILGAPTPPPPPNVPALENTEPGHVLSVRQRMEQHRANPACASCHKVMDPLGFALENFDAIGRWRTAGEAGAPIDATATLVDGTTIDGPATLRQAVLQRREEFVKTITEKLLTYALGRGVESYDAPTIRQIVRGAALSGYRWSSLIVGIAKSLPFQMRMSESPLEKETP